MSELKSISWIGCGKVGRTLARVLQHAGYATGTVVCRKLDSAKKAVEFIGEGTPSTDPLEAIESAHIHFIATNDDSIESVVLAIDSKYEGTLENHYFFHTSGSISSKILEPLARKKAFCASIHPLQVFADPQKALETLQGSYYAIEGDDKAMELAVRLVDAMQGKLLLIPTGRKVLYHIAGVFAANYLTVLVQIALEIMEDLGETPEDSFDAFLPLIVGALQNIEALGVPGALTGPVARGDSDTIRRHLQELSALRPEISQLYSALGIEAVDLALKSGKVSLKKAEELRNHFVKKETIH